MQYTRIGKSDLAASRLALDCRTLGLVQHDRGWDPGSYDGKVFATRTLHAALDAGINLFDSSPDADGGRGEALIGQALAGRQESALLTTRLGRTGKEAAPESRILATLRRLRADHLDIVYVDDRCGQWLSMLAPLARLRERGVVRFLGLEISNPDHAARLIATDLFDVALFDGNIVRRAETTLRISEAISRGMGVGISNPGAANPLPRMSNRMPDDIFDGSRNHEALLKKLLTKNRFDFVSLDMHWEHEIATSSRMVADTEPAVIPLAMTH